VRALRRPGVVAVATWLLTMPVAFLLPSVVRLNPFTQRGADAPLAGLLWAALVLVLVAFRWRGPVVVGVTAGVFASFVMFVLRTALSGTPFGYEDFYGAGDRISPMGDAGRIAAMAVRYTVTWASSDGIVAGVPSEYPPLFPYTIGKVALLLDTPAWRLMGVAQALTLSASVLIGFVLWARLVAPPAALAISALGPVSFGTPTKAYEVLALAVFVPLVLTTVVRPPGGRMHWLPAGLIAGAMVLTYYAYIVFAAVGLIGLAWHTWRAETGRRTYVLYLARTAAVAAVVSAWFTLPYLWAMANGGQQIGDVYSDSKISQNPFPFLSMDPLGLVQLAGLAGLLWYARTAWWAVPLLSITAGAYAYQAISMVRWVTTAHSGLIYYTMPLISACLIAGGVLSAREAVPALARRVRRSLAARAGVAVMTVVLVAAGYAYWAEWMPVNKWQPRYDGGADPVWAVGEYHNQMAIRAQYQYFPDGTQPRYADLAEPASHTDPPGQWRLLPIEAIERAARQTRPRDVRPRTLSYDEQLFAFLPWRGYIGVDRVASYAPTRWHERHDELIRLSGITDPAAFAAASARTRFGPIDVFVLRAEGDDLVWAGLQISETLRFRRSQFAPSGFALTDVGAGTVVAVRRP
jgi:hypothetical protein